MRGWPSEILDTQSFRDRTRTSLGTEGPFDPILECGHGSYGSAAGLRVTSDEARYISEAVRPSIAVYCTYCTKGFRL